MEINKILQGDSLARLKELPDESIDCCVTSPPYWALRDYNMDGQLGLEPTFYEYVEKLCVIFDEVKRLLKKSGTVFINLGDTYGGSGKGAMGYSNKSTLNGGRGINENEKGRRLAKESWHFKKAPKVSGDIEKSLCQIPARFALAMGERGWILRNEIIWHKPNAMPSSADDRFTIDYEKIFFFVKSKQYYFETLRQPHSDVSLARIEKPWHWKLTKGHALGGLKDGDMSKMCHPDGRNMRTTWSINTGSYQEAHFATFPEELPARMISSGCPIGGVVLDPFMGAGTTGLVARKLGRNYLGIELNPAYISMAEKRIASIGEPLFLDKTAQNTLSTPLPNDPLTSPTRSLE